MATTTTPPPEPVPDTSSLGDLQARYVDLIDRYVRRRVPDARQADRVVRDVFRTAAANPGQVLAHPLPWLIGTARRGCAQVRRANLPRA